MIDKDGNFYFARDEHADEQYHEGDSLDGMLRALPITILILLIYYLITTTGK